MFHEGNFHSCVTPAFKSTALKNKSLALYVWYNEKFLFNFSQNFLPILIIFINYAYTCQNRSPCAAYGVI